MPTKPPAHRPRKPASPPRLPAAPPEGYRHPDYPDLVWRGSNWVVEGRGEPFSITDEIEADRETR